MVLSKPVIAAVAGHAVAGGLELALWCDMRVVEEDAIMGVFCRRWGVPLVDGGTVRLPRLIGQARAMDLILTGRTMDAAEAERCGLVARLVPLEDLMEEAMSAAKKIASMSRPIAMMTKETVNAAYETTLSQGIRFERRLFQSMFATHDQKEGMAAFIEKRAAHFKNR